MGGSPGGRITLNQYLMQKASEFVIITGGSSGFGLELARRFALDGHPLLLAALPGQDLEQAAEELRQRHPGLPVHAFAVDLSKPEGPDALFAFTREQGLVIGGVVNNAGFGTWGFLPDIPQHSEEGMIGLNVLGLYRVTRLFLPDMVARGKGRIMHIASIAAFQPNPYMATYGATKAFVRSFSQALSRELVDRGSPVRIITVCPPASRTPFRDRAGMDRSALFAGWLSVDASLVADAAYRAWHKGQDLMIPGRLFRMLHVVTRLLPESLSIVVAQRTLRKGLHRA